MDLLIPVLIVDDEYLIRSLVRNSADWESLGFRIVGEAEDGEQALALVESLRPRLLVVDINIPFVNGLDLSQAVRLRHPEIKIIILTGYEDFGYARRAIRTGVLRYILKPINTEELREALLAARESIVSEESRLYPGDGRSAAVGDEAGALKENFLRSLLSAGGAASEADILQRFALFRIGLRPRAFVVIRLVVDPPGTEVPVPEGACESFRDDSGGLALLTNDDMSTARLKDKSYYELCEDLRGRLAARGIGVTAGIGRPAADFADIPRSWAEAGRALDGMFYGGTNRTYVWSGEAGNEGAFDFRAAFNRDELLLLFRGGDAAAAEERIRGIFRELARTRPARRYCETAAFELVSAAGEFLEEYNLSAADLWGGEGDVFTAIRNRRTLADLEEWVVGLAAGAVRRAEAGRATRTRHLVRKAKRYIDRNYGRKSLTLERIAEFCSVTPSYISTVFKKDMGLSLVEYITEFRLRKAKEIMDRQPDIAIMDAAERVGYGDAYYFSKCFRRLYGVSPSAYLRGKDAGEK